MNTTDPEPVCMSGMQYIRPHTIAKLMDVSLDTVRAMISKGELRAVKFGGHWRVELASFQECLERRRSKGELEAPS